jgi:hypothetical protein
MYENQDNERPEDGQGEPPDGAQDGAPDDDAQDGGDIVIRQDAYRRVIFGQIIDGLLPRRPGPNAMLDGELEELNRAAMSDPAALEGDAPKEKPTLWRMVFLIMLMAFALAVVFWKK